MTVTAPIRLSIQAQIQTTINKTSNERLKETMEVIQQFVLGKANETSARKAIFDYIDLGVDKAFSAVIRNPMNQIVFNAYNNYTKLVSAFFNSLKSAPSYNVIYHFNQIVKTATGPMGVIEAANCANFAGLS